VIESIDEYDEWVKSINEQYSVPSELRDELIEYLQFRESNLA